MYDDLNGKTALITGAGSKSGIGYAIAHKLAACGTNIIITDIGEINDDQEGATTQPSVEMGDIAGHLNAEFGVKTQALCLDVTCTNSINLALQAVKTQFKTIEILINNAGVVLGVPAEMRNYNEKDWVKTVDVNLHGAFRVSQAVLPLMGGTQASIVNVSSRAGKAPPLWNGAYAVSKAGLIMLTKVMALELASSNIRVNAICPGMIMTDLQMNRLQMEADFRGTDVIDQEKELSQRVPQGRLGSPAEVAAMVVYLVSNEASYVTGQAINVCGGQTMEL